MRALSWVRPRNGRRAGCRITSAGWRNADWYAERSRPGSDARYPDVALTRAGRDAIESSAPVNAARVRKLFIDVLGPQRLAMLRKASDDVLVAIESATSSR